MELMELRAEEERLMEQLQAAGPVGAAHGEEGGTEGSSPPPPPPPVGDLATDGAAGGHPVLTHDEVML